MFSCAGSAPSLSTYLVFLRQKSVAGFIVTNRKQTEELRYLHE